MYKWRDIKLLKDLNTQNVYRKYSLTSKWGQTVKKIMKIAILQEQGRHFKAPYKHGWINQSYYYKATL